MIRNLLELTVSGVFEIDQGNPADILKRLATSIGGDLGKVPRGLLITFFALLSWCVLVVVAWLFLSLTGII